MAIYHLTAKTGSRNGGQSAKAKADYIQREGRYSRDRAEVLHTQSGHLPEWAERPADYWDAADLYERANGRLFKEVEFALPVELTLDQQRELVDEFARHLTEGERLPYTGCSIVFLHHASKGAAMMGAGDQQKASRGSSVLVDNIRWQSYLSGMTADEAEEWGVDDSQRPYFVRYGVSKANYGAPFKDRWFRRHEGGVLKPAVLEKQRKSKGVRRGEA